jgi:hypothetical protein
MEDVRRPAIMRQRHDDYLDLLAEQATQLPNPFGVGAVPAADRHGVFIEPDDVAALEQAWPADRASDRQPQIAPCPLLRRRLIPARGFAHAAQDYAARGDDRGITNVDGVECQAIAQRHFGDLGARSTDQLDEPRVLFDGGLEIGRRRKVERAPLIRNAQGIAKGLSRRTDGDPGKPVILVRHGA